mgnify:CR=1 FL=1
MSIHVALNHVTHYRYDRPIMLGPQVVRLRPAPHARTPVLSYSQRVTPEKHFVNWQQDAQSNWLARLVFPEPVRELKIEVDLVAEMSVLNPFDFSANPLAGAPAPAKIAGQNANILPDAAAVMTVRATRAERKRMLLPEGDRLAPVTPARASPCSP